MRRPLSAVRHPHPHFTESRCRKRQLFYHCSSCYCFRDWGIESAIDQTTETKGSKPFMRDLARTATWPVKFGLKTPIRYISMHVKIATCQRNTSQHCWAQHVVYVWSPCCDVLRHVGYCWLSFDHFQTWANNSQHVATWCPNARSMLRPTMLRYVALACCDRLAGALITH